MAERLEKLYHDCWPNMSAEDTPADAAATDTVADNTEVVLNPWESNDIYEKV